MRDSDFKRFREWIIEQVPEDRSPYLVLLSESEAVLSKILDTYQDRKDLQAKLIPHS